MEENLKVVDIEKEKEEKIKENTARDTEAVLKEYEDTLGFSHSNWRKYICKAMINMAFYIL